MRDETSRDTPAILSTIKGEGAVEATELANPASKLVGRPITPRPQLHNSLQSPLYSMIIQSSVKLRQNQITIIRGVVQCTAPLSHVAQRRLTGVVPNLHDCAIPAQESATAAILSAKV